jgi:hypothetical protein
LTSKKLQLWIVLLQKKFGSSSDGLGWTSVFYVGVRRSALMAMALGQRREIEMVLQVIGKYFQLIYAYCTFGLN